MADGLKPGRGQRHIQLYSPWLPANDKSNPAQDTLVGQVVPLETTET